MQSARRQPSVGRHFYIFEGGGWSICCWAFMVTPTELMQDTFVTCANFEVLHTSLQCSQYGAINANSSDVFCLSKAAHCVPISVSRKVCSHKGRSCFDLMCRSTSFWFNTVSQSDFIPWLGMWFKLISFGVHVIFFVCEAKAQLKTQYVSATYLFNL